MTGTKACEKCGHIAGWDGYFQGYVCTNANCGYIEKVPAKEDNNGIELLKVIKQQDLDDAAALIFTVDIDNIDIETTKKIFDVVKDEFPDINVLMMPKYINLYTVSEFEIRSLINTMQTWLYEIAETKSDNAENGYEC